MSDVLILGGGFGGLAAAHRLRAVLPEDSAITVVDRRDRFFPGLAKLWDLVGASPLEANSRPLENLQRYGISFVHSEIRSIDPESRSIETATGTLSADAMLVALGADFKPGHLNLLDGERSFNLYDALSLPGLKRKLSQIERGRIVVTIMGLPYKCPPAPYEAIMLLDEWLRANGTRNTVQLAVYTPQPSPLPVAGAQASAAIAAELDRLGVELYPEHPLDSIEGDVVSFGDGHTDRADLIIGIPAHVAPQVVVDAGLTGGSGWVEPDAATLRTSFPGVYAVGDCTHIPNAKGALPKAGVFAEKEGLVAAQNIAAELGTGEGAELDGFGYCFLEFQGKRAANVEGDFFATPEPAVQMSPPDKETFQAKEHFVRERLERWL